MKKRRPRFYIPISTDLLTEEFDDLPEAQARYVEAARRGPIQTEETCSDDQPDD